MRIRYSIHKKSYRYLHTNMSLTFSCLTNSKSFRDTELCLRLYNYCCTN